MSSYLADTHVHTKYSWDSRLEIPTIIECLEKLGLNYVVFTDHIEFDRQWPEEVIHRLEMRNDEIDKLQKKTNIKLVKGVEVSEPHLYKDELKAVRDQIELDCVYGSIHHILGQPMKKIAGYEDAYKIYAESIYQMVLDSDIDVVAHLDYIKKYNMQKTINDEMLIKILSAIIEKNLVLEINTHTRHMEEQYPSKHILDTYKELGGKRVSIGSDTHEKGELYNNIPEASELADSYGFSKGLVINKSFRGI